MFEKIQKVIIHFGVEDTLALFTLMSAVVLVLWSISIYLLGRD